MDAFWELYATPVWWSYLLRIVLFFVLAWVAHIVSSMRFGRIFRRLTTRRTDRMETTRRLISSFITIIAFILATILSLALFIPADSLFWILGLFTGGFGLALMPLMRDFFTGITFLFEDTFDVGESVQINTGVEIDGLVEHVNIRTTSIRARTGELYTIPNGEIRVIRNFSRGHFSTANIVLALESADLTTALNKLDAIREDALLHLPNLLEPWQVISEDGRIGQRVQLKLIAKARYGQAATLRPRLLAYVREHLTTANVDLTT